MASSSALLLDRLASHSAAGPSSHSVCPGRGRLVSTMQVVCEGGTAKHRRLGLEAPGPQHATPPCPVLAAAPLRASRHAHRQRQPQRRAGRQGVSPQVRRRRGGAGRSAALRNSGVLLLMRCREGCDLVAHCFRRPLRQQDGDRVAAALLLEGAAAAAAAAWRLRAPPPLAARRCKRPTTRCAAAAAALLLQQGAASAGAAVPGVKIHMRTWMSEGAVSSVPNPKP